MLVYTDGGSYNNGDRKGDGSWAWCAIDDNTLVIGYVDIACKFIQNTTNNRTEMMAVISALKCLNKYGCNKCTIVSDSGYVVNGYTDPRYLQRWMKSGWKTVSNNDVVNQDLWRELIKISWHIGFDFIHIKGHNKDSNKDHAYWNNIVDGACTYMMNEVRVPNMYCILRYDLKSRTYTPIYSELEESDEVNM